MSKKFHERFNIQVPLEEAKRRFVNRVTNALIYDVMLAATHMSGVDGAWSLERHICQKLGERWKGYGCLVQILGDHFESCLQALEGLYSHPNHKDLADKIARSILEEAEIDLGIRWKDGKFLPSGAPLLDEKLVNDVLGLVNLPAYKGVSEAFNKGLDHFLHSTQKPGLLSDVVTDMYEALEALAKIICKNDRDLSGNREAFISAVGLTDYYKRMLKDYIEYANDLHRHAAEKGQAKQPPSKKEVEAFIYLTGLFIRLALSE